VFGDPCYGTYKKLSVVYYCKKVALVVVPDEVKFASTGENGVIGAACN